MLAGFLLILLYVAINFATVVEFFSDVLDPAMGNHGDIRCFADGTAHCCADDRQQSQLSLRFYVSRRHVSNTADQKDSRGSRFAGSCCRLFTRKTSAIRWNICSSCISWRRIVSVTSCTIWIEVRGWQRSTGSTPMETQWWRRTENLKNWPIRPRNR